ncbi:cyclic nucleotide-binding domain-containing protein [Streptomyces angustmyceticus]
MLCCADDAQLAHPGPRGLSRHVAAEARTAFTRLGTRCRYVAGDVLIHEGDHAQELLVLHEGLVKVTARLDRDRVWLMDIRVAGDLVGEVAAMGCGPRSATVTACGDVIATVVPRDELEPFLRLGGGK